MTNPGRHHHFNALLNINNQSDTHTIGESLFIANLLLMLVMQCVILYTCIYKSLKTITDTDQGLKWRL